MGFYRGRRFLLLFFSFSFLFSQVSSAEIDLTPESTGNPLVINGVKKNISLDIDFNPNSFDKIILNFAPYTDNLTRLLHVDVSCDAPGELYIMNTPGGAAALNAPSTLAAKKKKKKRKKKKRKRKKRRCKKKGKKSKKAVFAARTLPARKCSGGGSGGGSIKSNFTSWILKLTADGGTKMKNLIPFGTGNNSTGGSSGSGGGSGNIPGLPSNFCSTILTQLQAVVPSFPFIEALPPTERQDAIDQYILDYFAQNLTGICPPPKLSATLASGLSTVSVNGLVYQKGISQTNRLSLVITPDITKFSDEQKQNGIQCTVMHRYDRGDRCPALLKPVSDSTGNRLALISGIGFGEVAHLVSFKGDNPRKISKRTIKRHWGSYARVEPIPNTKKLLHAVLVNGTLQYGPFCPVYFKGTNHRQELNGF